MRIALGLDLADKKCAAYAVPVGKAKKAQREFLDGFNKDFRRVPTTKEDLQRMVDVLKDESDGIHVLIENSTITHKVYWLLVGMGCEVLVAQSADLLRITESVTKNDDNDAMELAAYMRRRLNGEDEFRTVVMTPPEIMAKKMFIRAIYVDKTYLSECKKRLRFRPKVMGADLRREYKDISCERSLTQLRETGDPYLCYEVAVIRATKSRIQDGERYISTLFKDDPYFDLLMTIPGFGLEISAYISTIIIDIDRFDDKKQLEAYSGLVPRQRSSADSDPNCRTTHHGDEWAREFLGYAVKAHVMWAKDSVVTIMYNRLRARGMPYKKVITACSRKMVDVVWSVLKNGRSFTSDQNVLRQARGAAAEIERMDSELSEQELDAKYAEAA